MSSTKFNKVIQSLSRNRLFKRATFFGILAVVSPFLLIPLFIIIPAFRFLEKFFYWDLLSPFGIGLIGSDNSFPSRYGLFALFIFGFILSLFFSLLRQKKNFIASVILLTLPVLLSLIYFVLPISARCFLAFSVPRYSAVAYTYNYNAAQCWEDSAIKLKDVTYCDNIEFIGSDGGTYSRSGCYYQFAKDTQDADLCEKTRDLFNSRSNFNGHKHCLYDIAQKLKSPEVCAMMDPAYFEVPNISQDFYHNRDWCYFSLIEMGAPISLCRKIDNGMYKSLCQKQWEK